MPANPRRKGIYVECAAAGKLLRFSLIGCAGHHNSIPLAKVLKAAIADADVEDALESADRRLYHYVLHPGIRAKLLAQIRRKIEKTRAKINVSA